MSGQLRSRLRSRLASDGIRFGQAVATKCCVTSEATWGSRAFTGDDQCWPSARLLSCRGTSATARVLRRVTFAAARVSSQLVQNLPHDRSELVWEQPILVRERGRRQNWSRIPQNWDLVCRRQSWSRSSYWRTAGKTATKPATAGKNPGLGSLLYYATLTRASVRGPQHGAMVAAVAQLYLGSMAFFALRDARAASGSAWRLLIPQLRLWGYGLLLCSSNVSFTQKPKP